jgi:2-dehydro-3-deoxyphosphogluconate aldolase/(4S)-4-hydroxy-2-oxoglutarate aldolase
MNDVKLVINKYKIIAIMRNVALKDVLPTVKALYKGGIHLVEVTFNQKSETCIEDTVNSIKQINDFSDGNMFVGAGTVLTNEQVDAAVSAGAKYIISPNTNLEVIRHTIKLGAVSIPGAFTPSEITTAYEAGASYVKLFPAEVLGINYIKAIRGPINHIPLLAVGGVNDENLKDFFAVGVSGVGIGSNIVKSSLIKEGKLDELTELTKKYTVQIHAD